MTPRTVRPGVAVAVLVCGILGVAMLLRLSLGFRSEAPASSAARSSSAPRSAPMSRETGWVARDSGDLGEPPSESADPVRAGVPPPAGGGVKAGPGGSAVVAGDRSDIAAAGSSSKAYEARYTGGANRADPAADGSGQRGSTDARSSGGESADPVGAPGSVTGSAQGARAPAVEAAAAEPGQNPNAVASVFGEGVVLFDSSKQQEFPADSRLQIEDAKNIISGEAGTISFWLQPQWDGSDQTSGTLVQLGNAEAKQNALEIFKDGQSLHLSLADNSRTQVETSSLIDTWRYGEQHLVTATWGQGAVAFYIDGRLVGQQPFAGQLDVPPQTPLDIGSGYPDATTLPGVLSDFRMYKRTLGANEVADQALVAPSAARAN